MITSRNYYNHSDYCSNVIIINARKQPGISERAKAIVGTGPMDHCLNVKISNNLKINQDFSVINIITLK